MTAGWHLEHDWFAQAVPGSVSLGERSWLYSSFAFRHFASRRPDAVRVGNDTGLYNGTFFDLGPEGEVCIGSFCTLVGAIICSNGLVTLGDYVFVAHDVVIADSFAAIPGAANPRRESPGTAAGSRQPQVSIDSNAWIGARAVLLAGARVGHDSIIGAAAVVDFEVPPGSIVAGNPARIVGTIEGTSL